MTTADMTGQHMHARSRGPKFRRLNARKSYQLIYYMLIATSGIQQSQCHPAPVGGAQVYEETREIRSLQQVIYEA